MQAAGAAEHGLDPGQQLARAEGLGDVVVGADLEADDAVGLLDQGGEQDDRQVGGLADHPAERQPVLARHHDVEDDEIDGAGLQDAAHLLAAVGGRDAKPLLGEVLRQRLADVGRVVDDEDVRAGFHELSLLGGQRHYGGGRRGAREKL